MPVGRQRLERLCLDQRQLAAPAPARERSAPRRIAIACQAPARDGFGFLYPHERHFRVRREQERFDDARGRAWAPVRLRAVEVEVERRHDDPRDDLERRARGAFRVEDDARRHAEHEDCATRRPLAPRPRSRIPATRTMRRRPPVRGRGCVPRATGARTRPGRRRRPEDDPGRRRARRRGSGRSPARSRSRLQA